MLQAVLFDFNGVIVDDEHLQYQAVAAALAEDGLALSRQQYFAHYLGLDDAACLVAVLRDRGEPSCPPQRLRRLLRRKLELYLRWLQDGERGDPGRQVCLFPGVESLVRDLAADRPLAICSGAPRDEIEAVLATTRLRDCFTRVVTAADVPAGKPDPAIFLRAAELLGLPPQGCLVIEDSPRGVEAARAAGMRCVALTNSSPAGDLQRADRIVKSLEQVTPADLEALYR